jgi:hypothetical protein
MTQSLYSWLAIPVLLVDEHHPLLIRQRGELLAQVSAQYWSASPIQMRQIGASLQWDCNLVNRWQEDPSTGLNCLSDLLLKCFMDCFPTRIFKEYGMHWHLYNHDLWSIISGKVENGS